MRPIVVAALVLAVLAEPAVAEPLTEDAKTDIWRSLLHFEAAIAVGLQKDPEITAKLAGSHCRTAADVTAKFDPDPFYNGLIANCFGGIERLLNNRPSACSHYARAVQRLQAVPANHPDASAANDELANANKHRTELGC